MQRREWVTADKSAWGEGPWQQEPDKVQWSDEATGLPCLAVRSETMGHWCGYVGVAPGHPHYEVKWKDDRIDVSVHGGVTFTDACQPGEDEATGVCHIPDPGESDQVWWIGFDCIHAGDMAPKMQATLRLTAPLFTATMPGRIKEAFAHLWSDDTYKTLDYVTAECADLAGQLKAMA